MKLCAGYENNPDNPVRCMHTLTARGSYVIILAEQEIVAAAGMSHELLQGQDMMVYA